jgi:hypothetical protein
MKKFLFVLRLQREISFGVRSKNQFWMEIQWNGIMLAPIFPPSIISPFNLMRGRNDCLKELILLKAWIRASKAFIPSQGAMVECDDFPKNSTSNPAIAMVGRKHPSYILGWLISDISTSPYNPALMISILPPPFSSA